VVLPGAKIGKHVAVGANSVVTGELPDFCVAVGAPARVIRQYTPESGWTPRKN
jgi:acetyltransferase-like isoleucine patch superfamily enzyme